MGPTPDFPANADCHGSWVPLPSGATMPIPETTTLRSTRCMFPYFLCSLMKLTASWTVLMCSASSSGISTSNSSSIAITSSTMSRESAPRSSMKADSALISSSPTPSCSAMMLLTFASTDMADPFARFPVPNWRGLVARFCALASPPASHLLTHSVDAAIALRAVEVRRATHRRRPGHALPVVAGFGVQAVAVVVAIVGRGAPFVADADLADLPFLAILMSGALHGAVVVAAAVRVQALRVSVRPRLRAVALAVAEGMVLAGLPRGRHAAVRQLAALHALEPVGAVEVLAARVVAHLLLQLALAGAGGSREQQKDKDAPHLKTSPSTARSPAGSSTA